MHTHNIFALLPPIVSINPIVIQQSGWYDFRGTKLVTLLSKSFGNDPGSERTLSLRWRSSTTDHPQISPFHRHLWSSFRARRLIKQRQIDSLVIKISRFLSFFENWCNSLWIAEMSISAWSCRWDGMRHHSFSISSRWYHSNLYVPCPPPLRHTNPHILPLPLWFVSWQNYKIN